LLRDCLVEQKKARKKDPHTEERLEGLAEFFESTSSCYARMAKLPTSTLRKLSRMGDKLLQLLPI
jgi:hypothetical protein